MPCHVSNGLNVRSDELDSLHSTDRTDAVREPAVQEGFVGGTALGEAQVTFALKRLERAQQNRLPAPLPARREEPIESAERDGTDAPVGRQVAIILAVAIERVSALWRKVVAT